MQKCIAADLRYKTLNTFMEKEEICRSLKLVQNLLLPILGNSSVNTHKQSLFNKNALESSRGIPPIHFRLWSTYKILRAETLCFNYI
jgi:hypothetical protein